MLEQPCIWLLLSLTRLCYNAQATITQIWYRRKYPRSARHDVAQYVCYAIAMDNKKQSNKSGVGLLIVGVLLSPFMFMVWGALFDRDGYSAGGGFDTLAAIIGGTVPAIASFLCIALGLARIFSKRRTDADDIQSGLIESDELTPAEVTRLKSNLFALYAVTFLVGIALAFSLFMTLVIVTNLGVLAWIFVPLLGPAAIITGIIFFKNCNKIKDQRETIASATSKYSR